jgi:hypothetical protein
MNSLLPTSGRLSDYQSASVPVSLQPPFPPPVYTHYHHHQHHSCLADQPGSTRVPRYLQDDDSPIHHDYHLVQSPSSPSCFYRASSFAIHQLLGLRRHVTASQRPLYGATETMGGSMAGSHGLYMTSSPPRTPNVGTSGYERGAIYDTGRGRTWTGTPRCDDVSLTAGCVSGALLTSSREAEFLSRCSASLAAELRTNSSCRVVRQYDVDFYRVNAATCSKLTLIL